MDIFIYIACSLLSALVGGGFVVWSTKHNFAKTNKANKISEINKAIDELDYSVYMVWQQNPSLKTHAEEMIVQSAYKITYNVESLKKLCIQFSPKNRQEIEAKFVEIRRCVTQDIEKIIASSDFEESDYARSSRLRDYKQAIDDIEKLLGIK